MGNLLFALLNTAIMIPLVALAANPSVAPSLANSIITYVLVGSCILGAIAGWVRAFTSTRKRHLIVLFYLPYALFAVFIGTSFNQAL